MVMISLCLKTKEGLEVSRFLELVMHDHLFI